MPLSRHLIPGYSRGNLHADNAPYIAFDEKPVLNVNQCQVSQTAVCEPCFLGRKSKLRSCTCLLPLRITNILGPPHPGLFLLLQMRGSGRGNALFRKNSPPDPSPTHTLLCSCLASPCILQHIFTKFLKWVKTALSTDLFCKIPVLYFM